MWRPKSDRYLYVGVIYIVAIISFTVTDDPKFAEPIPNVTVVLGRDASLPCVVDHLGSYKVAWIHIDRQMILTIHRHVISKVPRYSVTNENEKTWVLHVTGVQQEDKGYYMCQVNTNPMISQVGYLRVVVPPHIIDTESTQFTVAVRENQNISLMCKADGYPIPKIIWRREDGQAISIERQKKVSVYTQERLSIVRITRSEMGAYLCIATNGVPPSVSKRIIVDVEFPPMIYVPNQLVGAPVGTDVTLHCHVEAYPRAISYWARDGAVLLASKKHGTESAENGYRTHMRMTVRRLAETDFGNYRCVAKNALGEAEGSIRLYGSLYLAKLGNQTKSLQNPLGNSQNIFSEEYKKEESELAENDFIKALCSKIQGEKPPECFKSAAQKPLLQVLPQVLLATVLASVVLSIVPHRVF